MKIKDRASFFSFFLRSPYMMSASYEQRNKSARRGAQLVPNCLLKNTSTKDNKNVVNQKLEHVDDMAIKQ